MSIALTYIIHTYITFSHTIVIVVENAKEHIQMLKMSIRT